MTKLKTTLGALLLLGGIPLTLLTAAEVAGLKPPPNTREDSAVALLCLGLLPSGIGGFLLWHQRQRRSKTQATHLDQVLYELILENQGQVTPLTFAMRSGLDGVAAKAYLDTKAKEFDANFYPTEGGTVAYVFDLGTPKGLLGEG